MLGIRAPGTACPPARFRSSRNASRSTPAGFVCDPRSAWRLHPGDCRRCRRHAQDRRRTLVGSRTGASLSPFASLLGIAGRQRHAHLTRRCSSAAVLARAARLVSGLADRLPSESGLSSMARPATGNSAAPYGSVPPTATVSGPPHPAHPRPRRWRSGLLARWPRSWPTSSAPSLFSWSPTPCRRRPCRSIRPNARTERFRRGRSNAHAAPGLSPGRLPAGERTLGLTACLRPGHHGRQSRLLRSPLPDDLPTAAARPARLLNRPLLPLFPSCIPRSSRHSLVGGWTGRPRPVLLRVAFIPRVRGLARCRSPRRSG